MKTGVPHTVLRRAFPSVRQLAIRQAASISHVNAPGLHRSLAPEGEMLGRAALAAEAKKPAPAPKPSGIASRNQSLAKTLFPSSSPNRSLDSWANSGSGSASTSAFSRAPAPAAKPDTTQPLRNRNNNTAYQPARPVDGKKFASIVSASNSFNDSPDTVDHAANRASTMSRPVFEIFDGDLSDDNDLDFEAPCSLPNLPRPVPSAAPQEPPPGTNNTAISWATSSPTHLAPARPSLKRGSTGNAGLERQPEPKKRQLPWKPSGRVDEDEVEELYEVAARPPPAKTKGPSMWDQPADDIKAQKKQLKSQQKEAAASKPEATAEDMREAVKISTSKAKVNAIALSSEQEHIKKLVVEKGQSVFFTGPAGTGKSVLMRAIIAEFKKKFVREPERLAVTASTGLAACNIGGMTLHSFAGIGLGKEDVPTLVKKIRRNPKAKGRWQKTKVLVVDEISMVDGQLFDKLSQIGRTIRNNGRPWGGIQLVITGDFFQLPPVPDHQNGGNERNVKFAFDASTWNLSIDHTIGLTQVFRQRDQEFADMLNEMRLGKITERTIQNFNSLSRPLQFNDELEVTELFPTRNEVDSSNKRRLAALPGKSYFYPALDTGKEPQLREKLLSNMMAPAALELKKGAQVMLIKNMDEGLVNGSLGTVVKFMSESTFEMIGGHAGVEEDSDQKKRIRAFSSALKASGKDDPEYPLVRFHAADGTERQVLCIPEAWKVELPTGEVQASRTQVPLILAWALSIHKAQGQTLERVKVDLGKVFEKGQAYVALSRATTQQGLQVLRFRKDKVMAHPRVIAFYNQLYSADKAMAMKVAVAPAGTSKAVEKKAVEKKAANSIKGFVAQQPPSRSYLQPDPHDYIDIDEDEEAIAAAYG